MVHILEQACASLEEAHVRGLVHRDIKPANIHVGRLGLVLDFVKVLDFGLVKPIADGNPEHSLTTQAGLMIGTPGYMAPEFALSDKVDGRADLYALGCVGYYLLTGQQVFEGDTVMQVMAKHLQVAPVPPSQRVPFAISPGLEAVVLACLAKKPEDRPQSAAELARRLAAIDVDPWTDVQAKAWWAAARDGSDAQGNGAASLPPPSSGSGETRLESPDANGRTILIDKCEGRRRDEGPGNAAPMSIRRTDTSRDWPPLLLGLIDMATVAVGDVHGNLPALLDLLGQLRGEVAEGDVVVFLGDYIDRGPDARGCVDAILAFRRESAARVVCLLGNHEDWLQRAQEDHTNHSWLLGMDGLDTVVSYSAEAADALSGAVREAGHRMYRTDCVIPYDVFFDTLPASHRAFFAELVLSFQSPDCICTHAGSIRGCQAWPTSRAGLIWGDADFQPTHRGRAPVVYCHWNKPIWPKYGGARGLWATPSDRYGVHGVLTEFECRPARFRAAAITSRPCADWKTGRLRKGRDDGTRLLPP